MNGKDGLQRNKRENRVWAAQFEVLETTDMGKTFETLVTCPAEGETDKGNQRSGEGTILDAPPVQLPI